jgi:ADP-heptose:LPS heptosyltransferase
MSRRLLIRPGAIGDFIVSLPALEALALPGYAEVWCAEQNVPLARFADRALSIGSAGENRPDFRELVESMALPFRFLRALPDGKCHAVDFYAAQARGLASGLGAEVSGNPRIVCPELPRTFAAIHPFASSQAKRAPMELFEAAAEKLGRSMPVRWLCGPEEELPDAVRIPDLYEVACWLRRARIFVGNDSGISHLAAAVGTPAAVFFRASDPKVWAPRGTAVDVLHYVP